MNTTRYGYISIPTAPPFMGCVICNTHSDHTRPFPCGCIKPIHPTCVPAFLRQGGVCSVCHQVWQPMDMDRGTVTTAYQPNEWLVEEFDGQQTCIGCTCCDPARKRSNYIYALCFVIVFVLGILTYYLLYKYF